MDSHSIWPAALIRHSVHVLLQTVWYGGYGIVSLTAYLPAAQRERLIRADNIHNVIHKSVLKI